MVDLDKKLSDLTLNKITPIDPRLCDTHHYDGKLTNTYDVYKLGRSLDENDLQTFRFTVSDIRGNIQTVLDNASIVFFKELYPLDDDIKLLSKIADAKMTLPSALRCLDMFIANENKSENFDTSNNVRVELVLVKVWKLICDELWDLTGKLEFFLQLSDIMGGSCPPGRTTRLLQFLS